MSMLWTRSRVPISLPGAGIPPDILHNLNHTVPCGTSIVGRDSGIKEEGSLALIWTVVRFALPCVSSLT